MFSLSDPPKTSFSLKLEVMRMSKFSTATKQIKNHESCVYMKKMRKNEKSRIFDFRSTKIENCEMKMFGHFHFSKTFFNSQKKAKIPKI